MPRALNRPSDGDEDRGAAARQTVVRSVAGHLPPPATTGVASVFAAGKKPRKPRGEVAPPLDPSAVEIKVGVPIPEPVTGKPSVYPQLFERMKDDSMVELPVKVARNFMYWGSKKHPGRLVIRKLGPDRCGVWKVKAAKK